MTTVCQQGCWLLAFGYWLFGDAGLCICQKLTANSYFLHQLFQIVHDFSACTCNISKPFLAVALLISAF